MVTLQSQTETPSHSGWFRWSKILYVPLPPEYKEREDCMQWALPASLFLWLCRTELIQECGALTLAALTLTQLGTDMMRHKSNVSAKIHHIFFCLQMKSISEHCRQALSGV